jgi:hypothetical protein
MAAVVAVAGTAEGAAPVGEEEEEADDDQGKGGKGMSTPAVDVVDALTRPHGDQPGGRGRPGRRC